MNEKWKPFFTHFFEIFIEYVGGDRMKPLDRGLQRRVWSRVYGGTPQRLTVRQRETLRRALARSGENLAFYEQMAHHALYAEAF